MRNEQNHSFAEQLMKLYAAAHLPAVALSDDFSVLCYSKAAQSALPYLTAPGGARAFFESYGIDSIKAEIAARGSFSIEGSSLFDGCALTLCALGDETGGYLLLPAISPVDSGLRPEGVLRAIGTFDSQYRTQLHQLFLALGNVTRVPAPEPLDEEHPNTAANLEQVSQSAFRLLRSCEWVSSYARLSHGIVPLNPVRVELYGWLRRLFADAGGVCETRGVPLFTTVPTGELFVLCDVERLTDVLVNLLSNACRFTRGGNEIDVRVEPLAGNVLSFSVSDKGLGIPPAVIPRVFQPYYSYDRGGHPFGGNGLGLAIVKDTVALLGGTVTITSLEGESTTVLFTVPVKYAPAPFYAAESDVPDYFTDRFSPLRVALADSSPVDGILANS